jgi:uncharacterized protein (TIGR00369 family)
MSTNEIAYGVPPYETLRTMSGLKYLQGICDGSLPQPPIANALSFRMIEVTNGTAVFVGTPSREFYNPIGSVHGGWHGALLDSCMGCAVHTTLEQGTGYTTVEYSVNLVRAIVEDTGPVRAEGRIIHRGRRLATADGRLLDQNGKLLADGTTTCMIISLTEAAAS